MKKLIFTFLFTASAFLSQAQLISDFENWHNFTGGMTPLTIPNGWNATDSIITYFGILLNPAGTFVAQVSKEMPGANGSATAIKVTTKNQSELTGVFPAGPFPCTATNSKINVDVNTGDFSFVGGTPCGYDPSYATMWIKNLPLSGDSNSITILALDNSDGSDSLVCYADTTLGATINTYTQITLPFKGYNPNFSTTQVRILISSSSNADMDTSGAFINLTNGTSIIVDDISIAAPNGTTQYILSDKKAMVYPTIATDKLHVNLQANDSHRYEFSLVDIQGKKIKTYIVDKEFNVLNTAEIPTGNYIYQLVSDNKFIQSGKLTFNR